MSEVMTVEGPKGAGQQARREALPLPVRLGGAVSDRADSEPGVGVTVRIGRSGNVCSFRVVWALVNGYRVFGEFESAEELAEFFAGFAEKPKPKQKQDS